MAIIDSFIHFRQFSVNKLLSLTTSTSSSSCISTACASSRSTASVSGQSQSTGRRRCSSRVSTSTFNSLARSSSIASSFSTRHHSTIADNITPQPNMHSPSTPDYVLVDCILDRPATPVLPDLLLPTSPISADYIFHSASTALSLYDILPSDIPAKSLSTLEQDSQPGPAHSSLKQYATIQVTDEDLKLSTEQQPHAALQLQQRQIMQSRYGAKWLTIWEQEELLACQRRGADYERAMREVAEAKLHLFGIHTPGYADPVSDQELLLQPDISAMLCRETALERDLQAMTEEAALEMFLSSRSTSTATDTTGSITSPPESYNSRPLTPDLDPSPQLSTVSVTNSGVSTPSSLWERLRHVKSDSCSSAVILDNGAMMSSGVDARQVSAALDKQKEEEQMELPVSMPIIFPMTGRARARTRNVSVGSSLGSGFYGR